MGREDVGLCLREDVQEVVVLLWDFSVERGIRLGGGKEGRGSGLESRGAGIGRGGGCKGVGGRGWGMEALV